MHRYLVSATSTGVFHVQPKGTPDSGFTNTCNAGEQDCPDGEQPTHNLSSCALQTVTDTSVSSYRPYDHLGNGVLIGQFKLADGREALLLHNQNWDATLWPRVDFKPHINPGEVLEVDPVSGVEEVVMSDLYRPLHYNRSDPGTRILTLNLVAAEARLLVWSAVGAGLKTDDAAHADATPAVDGITTAGRLCSWPTCSLSAPSSSP